MTDSWQQIYVSAKVFGHLSQGLYRTPAGAIKELISNSFDADARLVRIHTGFPRFDTFSCEDDGTGLSREEFNRLMNKGIGSSYKRTTLPAFTQMLNRPVIGRLGLGILSLAQICTRFDMVSHHKESQSAFRATIKFPPYTRKEMDKLDKRSGTTDDDEIYGGRYQVAEEKYDAEKHGLRVFTRYLREPFRKRMRAIDNYANKKIFDDAGPYKNFNVFLDALYDTRTRTQSLNLLSDYDQLIFGLALAAPLPFVEARNLAVQLPVIRKRQAELKKYDFQVQVDNLYLANPVCVPSDAGGHTAKQCSLTGTRRKPFEVKDGSVTESCKVTQHSVAVHGSDEQFNLYEISYSSEDVGGSPLEFNGYLFQQTGRL